MDLGNADDASQSSESTISKKLKRNEEASTSDPGNSMSVAESDEYEEDEGAALYDEYEEEGSGTDLVPSLFKATASSHIAAGTDPVCAIRGSYYSDNDSGSVDCWDIVLNSNSSLNSVERTSVYGQAIRGLTLNKVVSGEGISSFWRWVLDCGFANASSPRSYEPPLQLCSPGLCSPGSCGEGKFTFNASVRNEPDLTSLCVREDLKVGSPCGFNCSEGLLLSNSCTENADGVCAACSPCQNSSCWDVCGIKSSPELPQKHELQQQRLILIVGSSGSTPSLEATQVFRLSELKDATNGFKEFNGLGRGSYGFVYKAVLTDGRTRLDREGIMPRSISFTLSSFLDINMQGWSVCILHAILKWPPDDGEEDADWLSHPSLRHFPWHPNQSCFKAWRQGQTGYPLVDAGMRELWATGWIHNRARVTVSSSFCAVRVFAVPDIAANENLLREGGYSQVYKGELKDGQLIAAKVHEEESIQGFTEFHSKVYVLSFARNKNIIMLLGCCCKENPNILVYDYICNKSLEWQLFENNNAETVLEWHRDMRPSNILLTHDYVPMLGDFGLTKWRTSDDPVHTQFVALTAGARHFWGIREDRHGADLESGILGWQYIPGSLPDGHDLDRLDNPEVQGYNFDPGGEDVRHWLPELVSLLTEWLHPPWDAPSTVLTAAGMELGLIYLNNWRWIVDLFMGTADTVRARGRALPHPVRLMQIGSWTKPD